MTVFEVAEIEGVVLLRVELPLLEELREGESGLLGIESGGAGLALEHLCEADVPGFHS